MSGAQKQKESEIGILELRNLDRMLGSGLPAVARRPTAVTMVAGRATRVWGCERAWDKATAALGFWMGQRGRGALLIWGIGVGGTPNPGGFRAWCGNFLRVGVQLRHV